MARKFAGEIAQALLAAGREPDEPAAIVANAARTDQQVIVTTLGGLPAAAENAPALAIIVIGENVRLAERTQLAGEDDRLRRSGSFSITARRSSSLMENQAPISSRVRPQPGTGRVPGS